MSAESRAMEESDERWFRGVDEEEPEPPFSLVSTEFTPLLRKQTTVECPRCGEEFVPPLPVQRSVTHGETQGDTK